MCERHVFSPVFIWGGGGGGDEGDGGREFGGGYLPKS